MTAEVLTIDPAHPETVFSRARDVIRSGGVIAYPTDTFYALGADPKNSSAVKRVFEIKGRRPDQPLLLLIKDASGVPEWTAERSPVAEALMQAHWPGPLTLVFRAKPDVLPGLTAGTGTVGLRVPGNALTLRLLDLLGCALTGTSANRSGRPNARTANEVAAELGDMIDLILDSGAAEGDMPSTVVDVTQTPARVIREGAVKLSVTELRRRS